MMRHVIVVENTEEQAKLCAVLCEDTAELDFKMVRVARVYDACKILQP